MQKFIVGAAALLLAGVATQAMADDNATATATANIITPIAVTKTQDLAFGNILAGSGGDVTVNSDDTTGVTGGVTLLTGSPVTAAHFHVVGDTNGGATYHVDYTKTNLTSGVNSMILVLGLPDTTPTSGTHDTKIGGTITVANAQAPGTYTGSVTATATYN